MIMETIQTRNATLPATPAMPPIEKRTSGGTPAATQKAPFQSKVRISSCAPRLPDCVAVEAI